MTTEWSAPLRLRRAELSWREIDGEVILLDLQSSEYLALNRVGAFLWAKLQESATDRRPLVDALVDRYGVEVARAEQDVDAFIARCEEKGLFEKDD